MNDPELAALKRVTDAALAGGLTEEQIGDLANRLEWLRRCAERLRAAPLGETEPAHVYRLREERS